MAVRQQSVSFTDDDSKEVKVYTFSDYGSKGKEKGKESLWRQDLRRPWQVARRSAAEFVGTTLLVFLTCSSTCQESSNGGVLHASLTMACAYATLVEALSSAGGCHLNPMVTIAFAVLGKVSWVRVMAYTNVQYAGAILGTYVYKVTTPESMRGFALCANKLNEGEGVTWWQGMVIEALITTAMTWVVLTVTNERGGLRPGGSAVIGLAYGAGHLMAIPSTSAGMNPARSLGPAVLGKYWDYNWVFAVGPQIGIKVAVLVYWLTRKRAGVPAEAVRVKTVKGEIAL